MMASLYCKYKDNIDSSQVTMKKFNESPIGRYPSFTFCLYAEDGLLFKEKILKEKYGMNTNDYYKLLNAEVKDTNETLQTIQFDEVVRGIDEFLEEFEVESESYEAYNEWEPTMGMKNFPFVSSYQDPTTNCVTYHTKYDPIISINALKVKFNITKFLDIFDDEGKMYVQAHYPGQMIRDVRTFLFKVSNWKFLSPKHNNNQILVQFPGVTLMRFRETAVETCDPGVDDDDSEWKEYVIKKIGCTPSYWNKNNQQLLGHDEGKICTSTKDLNSFKSYWPIDGGKYVNEVFKNYTKPCNKMVIFNNINQMAYEKIPDVLKIKIRICEDFYQEILNTRAFGVDDLWGSIGGYVGIFCGYSIMQGATYLIEKLQKVALNIL
jgi:hypothetical protein